jgi:F-type H+-transporting ATPase subunit alpha
LSVEQQVVAIFLGTKGHLDSVPVADVSRFESEFLEHLSGSDSGILNEIKTSQKLSEETEESLNRAVAEFKRGFATSDGTSVIPEENVKALDEADLEKETVKVRKSAPKKK